MNVFGKRARSWRKARKRGVSPIIATILLVAITVVLAAVLYVLISGLTKGPGASPITGTYSVSEISAKNFSLSIQNFPSAAWNDINYKVTNTAGAVQTGISYYVVTISGAVIVQSTGTSAGTSWTAATGYTTGQAVNSTQTLYVVSGTGGPASMLGFTLTTIGVNGYSGSFTTVLQSSA